MGRMTLSEIMRESMEAIAGYYDAAEIDEDDL